MRPPSWKSIRDGALFVGGMAGAAHETLAGKAERPQLLILFAAMMGLPMVLRGDEHRDTTPPAPPLAPPRPPPDPPPTRRRPIRVRRNEDDAR